MTGILLIMIAWVVEMPLWLSIVITVFSALHIGYDMIDLTVNVNFKDKSEKDDDDD